MQNVSRNAGNATASTSSSSTHFYFVVFPDNSPPIFNSAKLQNRIDPLQKDAALNDGLSAGQGVDPYSSTSFGRDARASVANMPLFSSTSVAPLFEEVAQQKLQQCAFRLSFSVGIASPVRRAAAPKAYGPGTSVGGHVSGSNGYLGGGANNSLGSAGSVPGNRKRRGTPVSAAPPHFPASSSSSHAPQSSSASSSGRHLHPSVSSDANASPSTIAAGAKNVTSAGGKKSASRLTDGTAPPHSNQDSTKEGNSATLAGSSSMEKDRKGPKVENADDSTLTPLIVSSPHEGPAYNLHIEEVKNTKGEVRVYRLIITSTFSVAVSPHTGQLITKRFAVALVVSFLPSVAPSSVLSMLLSSHVSGAQLTSPCDRSATTQVMLSFLEASISSLAPYFRNPLQSLFLPSPTYCLLLSNIGAIRHMLHVTLSFGMEYTKLYFVALLKGKDAKGIERNLVFGPSATTTTMEKEQTQMADSGADDRASWEGPDAIATYFWLKAILANTENTSHTLPALTSRTEEIAIPQRKSADHAADPRSKRHSVHAFQNASHPTTTTSCNDYSARQDGDDATRQHGSAAAGSGHSTSKTRAESSAKESFLHRSLRFFRGHRTRRRSMSKTRSKSQSNPRADRASSLSSQSLTSVSTATGTEAFGREADGENTFAARLKANSNKKRKNSMFQGKRPPIRDGTRHRSASVASLLSTPLLSHGSPNTSFGQSSVPSSRSSSSSDNSIQHGEHDHNKGKSKRSSLSSAKARAVSLGPSKRNEQDAYDERRAGMNRRQSISPGYGGGTESTDRGSAYATEQDDDDDDDGRVGDSILEMELEAVQFVSASRLVHAALRELINFNRDYASSIVHGLLSISNFDAYGLTKARNGNNSDSEDDEEESDRGSDMNLNRTDADDQEDDWITEGDANNSDGDTASDLSNEMEKPAAPTEQKDSEPRTCPTPTPSPLPPVPTPPSAPSALQQKETESVTSSARANVMETRSTAQSNATPPPPQANVLEQHQSINPPTITMDDKEKEKQVQEGQQQQQEPQQQLQQTQVTPADVSEANFSPQRVPLGVRPIRRRRPGVAPSADPPSSPSPSSSPSATTGSRGVAAGKLPTSATTSSPSPSNPVPSASQSMSTTANAAQPNAQLPSSSPATALPTTTTAKEVNQRKSSVTSHHSTRSLENERREQNEIGVAYELNKRLEGRVVIFCTDAVIARSVMVLAAFFFKRGKGSSPEKVRDLLAVLHATMSAAAVPDDASTLGSPTSSMKSPVATPVSGNQRTNLSTPVSLMPNILSPQPVNLAAAEDDESEDSNIFLSSHTSRSARGRESGTTWRPNGMKPTNPYNSGIQAATMHPMGAEEAESHAAWIEGAVSALWPPSAFAGRVGSCAHPSLPIQWVEENFSTSRLECLCNPYSSDNAILIIAPRSLICRRLELQKTFTQQTMMIECIPMPMPMSVQSQYPENGFSGVGMRGMQRVVRTDAVKQPFRCMTVKDEAVHANKMLRRFLTTAVNAEEKSKGAVRTVDVLEDGLPWFLQQSRPNAELEALQNILKSSTTTAERFARDATRGDRPMAAAAAKMSTSARTDGGGRSPRMQSRRFQHYYHHRHRNATKSNDSIDSLITAEES